MKGPLLVVAYGAALAAACTSFGAGGADETPGDAGTIDGATPPPVDPGQASDDAGVFSDDFEGPAPLPRGWSSLFPSPGAFEPAAGLGADGSTGLRVQVADGGVPLGVVLRREHGAPTGTRWRYELGFDAKASVASGNLHGPRITTRASAQVMGSGDNRLDFDVTFTPTGAHVATHSPACSALACGSFNVVPYPHGDTWHRYRLELDNEPGSAGAYGRLRFFVDETLVLDDVAPFPLYDTTARTTLFGASFANSGTQGSLQLDNAYVVVTDL